MPYNLNIPGFMTVRDLQIIELLAKKVPPHGIIIEVGSFMGRSSWTFAQSADPSVEVFCIDCWEPFILDACNKNVMAAYQEDMVFDFEAFKRYVKDCPNLIPIKSLSTHVQWPEDKKADLIFIDASHKSPDVDEDLAHWLPHLKPQGILCGHDFKVFEYPDVCRAVIALSEKLNLPIKFFKGSTIWVIERPYNHFIPEETNISNPVILEEIKELLK